jgi:hypothetical protein
MIAILLLNNMNIILYTIVINNNFLRKVEAT